MVNLSDERTEGHALRGERTHVVRSVPPTGSKPRRLRVLRKFLGQRGAVFSLVVLVVLVLFAGLGPLIWPISYETITPDVLVAPSAAHPFGTDTLGHDMFALVMRGAQRSLAVAGIVAVLSTAIGTLIGMIAGYAGGRLDQLLMRAVDLVLMMPLIAILGLVAVRVGGQPDGWILVSVAISLLYWTPTARLIRADVLALRSSEFVASAQLIGASTPRILFRHLLPHLVGPIAVVATTYVASAVALESTLSFLGLGVQPPDTSLGLLIGAGLGYASTAWWLFYIPGFVVIAIVLCVHFVGDGIQNAFNRSSKAA
ncbi:MAG: ABC transporter permease [Microbacterium sp.]